MHGFFVFWAFDSRLVLGFDSGVSGLLFEHRIFLIIAAAPAVVGAVAPLFKAACRSAQRREVVVWQ